MMEKLEFDSYLKAGKIAREVKDFARGLVAPGVKLIDLAEAIDAKIVELGGEIAFPVNLSLNEVAAHFTPEPDCEKIAEGILKIDIGVCVDGYIADCAFSVDLTSDGKYEKMLLLNGEILSRIRDKILGYGNSGYGGMGLKVKDVGDVAQGVLEKWNSENGTSFSIIKSLSGHVLGQNEIHAGLTISNYRNENLTGLDDVAFAIEPFVTTGVGDVFEGAVGGIYVLKNDRAVRDRTERDVLKFVREKFSGRPFCLRFLVDEFDLSLNKLRFILKSLVRQGVLYEYLMLVEKSRGVVSQFEETFVVFGGERVCSTG